MKFLIAGLGSIGRRHLRNLLALGEKDIVLYRTHQSTLPDDELVNFPTETNLQAALAHQPDAVIVANPTALHLDLAIPAAKAGCHLLLEKPISNTFKGTMQLGQTIAHSGSRVLVGFQFRFHPTLSKVGELLHSGAIGRPLSARAHWGEYLPGFHPWEDYRSSYAARSDLGGGVVLTLCHPLDYLGWMLGEAQSVWAFTGKASGLEISVEDTAEIGLRFNNGVIGSVHLDYTQRPATHTLEIVGEQGTLRWDNTSGKCSLYRAGVEPAGWEKFNLPQGFERNDLFLAEMRHFIALVRNEENTLCDFSEGMRSLLWALSAHKSAQEKRLVEL
jgi:predicted dehydrogenase